MPNIDTFRQSAEGLVVVPDPEEPRIENPTIHSAVLESSLTVTDQRDYLLEPENVYLHEVALSTPDPRWHSVGGHVFDGNMLILGKKAPTEAPKLEGQTFDAVALRRDLTEEELQAFKDADPIGRTAVKAYLELLQVTEVTPAQLTLQLAGVARPYVKI